MFVGDLTVTIVGTINLGTAGGEAHMGSFYGKHVVVAAAAVVQHTRYQGIASLGACAPLTSDERDKAVRQGLRCEAGAAMVNTAERFRW